MTTNNPFMPGNTATANTASAPMPGASNTARNDSFEIDLSSAESLKLPEGGYLAKCIEIEQTVSKGGNPMFVWTFQIAEGPFAGREFKNYTALTPAAMWKVAETVEAMGIPVKNGMATFKRSDVINKTCGIVLGDDEYQNRPVSRIQSVISTKALQELKKA